MKRFYKMTTVAAVPGGYEIHLDGRPVKTPSQKTLLVPDETLAQEIMREWAEQEEHILPDSMPLTQILTTCIDRVATERPVMKKAVLAYLNTDLLCYRTSNPAAVGAAQAAAWDPHLQWFKKMFGAALLTTDGLAALAQPEEARQAVSGHIAGLDDLRFTVLQLVVSLSGSLVLGLAFTAGDAGPEDVFNAAHVEEQYKAAIYDEEKYGAAPHEEKKRDAMRRDLAACRAILNTFKSSF